MLRYYYRNPSDGVVKGPFRLSVFAGWLERGTLPAEWAPRLHVWRPLKCEDAAVPLAQLLAAAHASLLP